METPESNEPEINNEEVNELRSFTILSDKNEFKVTFLNENDCLIISSQKLNSTNKFIYKNKLTFKDIRNAKLNARNIDECIVEIYKILDDKKGIIKEESEKLTLIIPVGSKICPEIKVPLFKREKSDSEKFGLIA